MLRTRWHLVVLALAGSLTALGAEISGTITLEKKAKKTVAPLAYELRGMAVADHGPHMQTSSPFERVAIWLEPKDPSPAPAPVSVSMYQQNRHLEPGLLVVPVGSTVEFPNSDPIFHNIFSLSKTQSFDLGYYPEGKSRSVTFAHPGIVQVYCHVHPNMYGAIVIVSSKWSGKPAPDGTFSWPDVPPGKYRFLVWEKSVGVSHRNIAVPETGSIHLNFAIPEIDSED